MPLKPTPPFIPGHEAIGIVSAVGADVAPVKEGDRVGVPWLYSACCHCEYCLKAWETVCPDAQFGGYTKNGGFAEYILADPKYVAHIPKGLAATQAAPLICAASPPTKARRARWRYAQNRERRPRPRPSPPIPIPPRCRPARSAPRWCPARRRPAIKTPFPLPF